MNKSCGVHNCTGKLGGHFDNKEASSIHLRVLKENFDENEGGCPLRGTLGSNLSLDKRTFLSLGLEGHKTQYAYPPHSLAHPTLLSSPPLSMSVYSVMPNKTPMWEGKLVAHLVMHTSRKSNPS